MNAATVTTLRYANTWETTLPTTLDVPYTQPPRTALVKQAAAPISNQTIDSGFEHHFAKTNRLVKDSSCWPDGAEAPSALAQSNAINMLVQLRFDQFEPARVVASGEGGIAICFAKADKYADIEFLNSGEILGVVSNRRDRPFVWEIAPTDPARASASRRIREFLNSPETSSNDTRRPWAARWLPFARSLV
ncbi:MAG: hypothetical protein JO038_05675 [Alphaproteobacteria bacterium]|nr:hypothetical protein [Alphaproteobacteria bacterium]